MSKKQHRESNQLSLALEQCSGSAANATQSLPAGHGQSATVIQFPAMPSKGTSFRERVIQDLVASRVMVAD
jgi:hypothetical protein